MVGFTIRRLLLAIIVILLVSIIVFLGLRLLPADPVLIYMSQSDQATMTPAKMEEMRHELGLDKALPVQYGEWLSKVVRLDFGKSIAYKEPVMTMIGRRLPVTVHLGILAFILSAVLGVVFGMLSGVRRGTWVDSVITTLANLGVALPPFWLGILLIYIFAFKWGLLPTSGYTSPFSDFWLSFRQIILPVFVLSTLPLCLVTRQTRSSLLEVLHQDYIRTAWSKGLSEKVIIIRHSLKNSLIPVITVIGMGVPLIFAGSVLVEVVFNIPGMGRLLVDAVNSLDYSMLQGGILLITVVVVICNLIVDISYSWIDPRVRY
jgi:peptide/nickel transport system permease protein